MKLPNLMTIKQAVTVAIAALVVAIFLQLFAPVAIGLLAMIAFVAGAYAAVKKWLPEFVKD